MGKTPAQEKLIPKGRRKATTPKKKKATPAKQTFVDRVLDPERPMPPKQQMTKQDEYDAERRRAAQEHNVVYTRQPLRSGAPMQSRIRVAPPERTPRQSVEFLANVLAPLRPKQLQTGNGAWWSGGTSCFGLIRAFPPPSWSA